MRIVIACLLLAACSTDPQPLRVWTPADHSHPPESQIDPNRVPQQERPNLTVGELLWQGHCARCHGPTGMGGKEASINFTSPDWQAGMTDARIARTIAGGKPPDMPSFADLLSQKQIGELVKHLRAFGSAAEAQ